MDGSRDALANDHIWQRRDISEVRKQALFEASVGIQCKQCWRRGRRFSELCRGAALYLSQRVRECNSSQMQDRASLLPEGLRHAVMGSFSGMVTGWCEEFEDKLKYYTQLPWLVGGLWPADADSGRIARMCVEQYKPECAHRVRFRFCDDAGAPFFAAMLRHCAQTGELHASLAEESKQYNLLDTNEQDTEGLHAKVHLLNMRPGRTIHPPTTSAKLRQAQHLRTLERSYAAMRFCSVI